jgi:hypothetical protein
VLQFFFFFFFAPATANRLLFQKQEMSSNLFSFNSTLLIALYVLFCTCVALAAEPTIAASALQGPLPGASLYDDTANPLLLQKGPYSGDQMLSPEEDVEWNATVHVSLLFFFFENLLFCRVVVTITLFFSINFAIYYCSF